MEHVGVDGCKAGWFTVTRNEESLAWQVFSTITELVNALTKAKRILIDTMSPAYQLFWRMPWLVHCGSKCGQTTFWTQPLHSSRPRHDEERWPRWLTNHSMICWDYRWR